MRGPGTVHRYLSYLVGEKLQIHRQCVPAQEDPGQVLVPLLPHRKLQLCLQAFYQFQPQHHQNLRPYKIHKYLLKTKYSFLRSCSSHLDYNMQQPTQKSYLCKPTIFHALKMLQKERPFLFSKRPFTLTSFDDKLKYHMSLLDEDIAIKLSFPIRQLQYIQLPQSFKSRNMNIHNLKMTLTQTVLKSVKCQTFQVSTHHCSVQMIKI